MFGIGWTEIAILLVVGLFVFGPERLPTIVADAARTVRQLRQMAQGLTDDLRSELGPELADLNLRSLHPQELLRRHVLDEVGFDDTVAGGVAAGTAVESLPGAAGPVPPRPARLLVPGEIPPYDLDAT